MIFGVGTDILRVARISEVFERHGERFPRRILGPEELVIYEARRLRSARRGVNFLATRFAAKEAFSKAIGLGIHMPMTWRAVQILKLPSGKPHVVANGALLAWMLERALHAEVSVSDDDDYVTAFAVVEVRR
jgi:holo-[acyl-carrier protein] synthase